MTCKELVELVTDYLEGALAPDALLRFEEHAGACPECMDYIAQIELTIRAVGRLRVDDVSPEARAALHAGFADWPVSPPGRLDG